MKRLLTFTTLTALCLSLALPISSSSPIAIDGVDARFSSEFNLFIEHVHGFYVKDIYYSNFPLLERATLLGFALGRQAVNVEDDERRKRIFQQIENELLPFLIILAVEEGKNRGENERWAVQVSVDAWIAAQFAMMGFDDDHIISQYRIDTSKIPNMFNPWSEGGDAVAGEYEAREINSSNPPGTLILNGNADRVEFDFKWGTEESWHWTGILEWDGRDGYKMKDLIGIASNTWEQVTRSHTVKLQIEEGIDGKWRGTGIAIVGRRYTLKKIR